MEHSIVLESIHLASIIGGRCFWYTSSLLNYEMFWYFLIYIAFAIHLDINYISIGNKSNESKKKLQTCYNFRTEGVFCREELMEKQQKN
jgi:hypothetical protein